MKVLVIDIGRTHIRNLASGHWAKREFPSGPTLTAKRMVAEVKQLAWGSTYDRLSIGYPGPALRIRPIAGHIRVFHPAHSAK